jgi:hypothetical protein
MTPKTHPADFHCSANWIAELLTYPLIFTDYFKTQTMPILTDREQPTTEKYLAISLR